MNKPELIVRGIIVSDNKILLCKNLKHSYYFLPGGHIEGGENADSAFRREVVEELGKVTKDIKFVAEVKNSYLEEDKEHGEVIYVYLATLEDYENIKSLENHIAFDWVPISEFDSTNFKPENAKKDILQSIKENKVFWSKH